MASYESAIRSRVRGVLIKNPSGAWDTSPYSGTVLGATDLHIWAPIPRIATVIAEEWGGEEATDFYMGENAVLTTVLRGWDEDAVAAIFPATEDDAGAKTAMYDPTGGTAGSVRAGTAQSTFNLLFAPVDTADHRAILLAGCQVHVELTAEIQHGQLADWGLPLIFKARPNADLPAYRWGLLANLPTLA